MSNRLKEVTFLTVKDLKRENIILPSQYSKVFESHAKRLEVDLEDENVVFKDLHQDMDYVDKVVYKTKENLNILHKSASNAQKAIANNDTQTLSNINEELLKMQKQIDFLQKELFSDPLTGAYNRKWFMDYYLNSGEKMPNDGFIIFIDLDKFKSINDSYGHLVGDQVLKYLVKFLQKELNFPEIDIVRYAGDEFLILFNKEKSTVVNLEVKVKEAQLKLSQQRLKSTKIDSLQFGFSYGFLPFRKNQDIEGILETVDELMYKNKQMNR